MNGAYRNEEEHEYGRKHERDERKKRNKENVDLGSHDRIHPGAVRWLRAAGGLKGPTSMGLMFLQEQAQNGQAQQEYAFTMAVGADELLPLMIKGELDIALVPANVASVLYGKTEH